MEESGILFLETKGYSHLNSLRFRHERIFNLNHKHDVII